MSFTSFCSTEIIFTDKNQLEQKFFDLESNNIVLIMSKSSALRWDMISFINKLNYHCTDKGGLLIWIDEINSNPTQLDIISSLHKIGKRTIDTIIAIGGGSSIDLAKAISAFYNQSMNEKYTYETITDSIISKDFQNNEFTNIVAVPTTAGTGAEVTQWATIWDAKKKSKYSIDDAKLKPKLAIITPELTYTVPPLNTLSTGLDAMCQAIEAYWSKKTTPIVQEIAYRAVEIIIDNLKKAIDEPANQIARENLCKASVLSGLAFSQTRTTACHSISYPLSMFFDVPHGLAVALTIDEVGKINKGHFLNDDRLFNLFDKYNGIMNWIKMVSSGLVTMNLSYFGIKKANIDLIIRNAFTKGRMDNNPVNLSQDDVKKMLLSLLN